jgi:hypothetical protein
MPENIIEIIPVKKTKENTKPTKRYEIREKGTGVEGWGADQFLWSFGRVYYWGDPGVDAGEITGAGK